MPAAREDDVVPDRSDVVRDSLGVGLATGLYGASFGALGVASGLSVLQTCAMSVLIFTGASQFAFVGVLASGGAPLSGALTALLLGSRNTLYGLRLAPLLALSRYERVADLIPVALLSALIAVQVFTTGSELTLDARAVGLGVAVVLLVLRAPFLVVVFGAAAVAALLRLVA